MLKLKVIGAGAAGNKAAISLAEYGFNADDITLINSTAKDIPSDNEINTIIFGANSISLGGCGKERDMGKRLILQDLKNSKIDLDGICDPDTNAVIIVSSTEGGSGSAVTPIIAKYIHNVIGVPVIVILFFGFNTDARGMQNSIEIAQELTEEYGIIGISNQKFLELANGNTMKAEMLANDHFVNIVNTLSGIDIHPGKQNIDDTDLYKLVTTPGYMCIETAEIKKIKNIEQYNKAIDAAYDSSFLIDCSETGAKRIGVIYDLSEDRSDIIDFNAGAIKTKYGTPYEMYTHYQITGEDSGDTVTWIAAGLPMPIKEIEEIYENYLESSSQVRKNRDVFFDEVLGLRGNQEDGMFNMLTPKKPNNNRDSKTDFFAGFGFPTEKSNPPKAVITDKGGNEY